LVQARRLGEKKLVSAHEKDIKPTYRRRVNEAIAACR
jgi:hypothetical protein